MRDQLYPLPDREWLRLQEATTFAFYGVSFSSCLMTWRELNEIDRKRGELNYPCIYRSIDFDDTNARLQIETEFNSKLNEAALSGRVRFQIEGEVIPIWQFKEPREFSLVDDTIRTRVFMNGEPVVPHLREAMIERASFLVWLSGTYQDLFDGMVVRSGKGGRPPQHHARTYDALLNELFENHHGPLSSDDPDWNAQGKVAAELLKLFIARHPKAKPAGETWLKNHVKAYLASHPDKDGREQKDRRERRKSS